MPISSDVPTTTRASSSDGRAPYTSWASTSHPNASVPNGCVSPKPWGWIFDSVIRQLCGSVSVNTQGKATTNMKKARITAAAMVSGRRRRLRQASAVNVREAASFTAVVTSGVGRCVTHI